MVSGGEKLQCSMRNRTVNLKRFGAGVPMLPPELYTLLQTFNFTLWMNYI